jgi:uncharacterized membrane protein YgcG
MAGTAATFAWTLVLALALWVLFYLQRMPLQSGETLVVVALCAAAVAAARRGAAAVRRRRAGAAAPAAPPAGPPAAPGPEADA